MQATQFCSRADLSSEYAQPGETLLVLLPHLQQQYTRYMS